MKIYPKILSKSKGLIKEVVELKEKKVYSKRKQLFDLASQFILKLYKTKGNDKVDSISYTRNQILEHLKNKGAISPYSTHDILNKITEYVQKNKSTFGLSFSGENLAGIDLSQETIQRELKDQGYSEDKPPSWYSGYLKQAIIYKRAEVIISAREPNASEVISKKSINLEGVDFSDAVLVCADLEGADLNKANFQSARLQYINLRKARLFDANFIDARLNHADLTGAALQNANFTWATLRGAIIYKCLLYHVKLEKTEMDRTQVEQIWEEIRAKEEKKANKNPRRHYVDAAIAYNRIKNNFVSIGRYNDAGWAFIKEMRMERNTYKRYSLKWWLNLFMDISCGYGEHPSKAIILTLAIVIIFGFIYWFLGGIKTTDPNIDVNWLDNFIFSSGSLVAQIFPDLNPSNYYIKIISNIESAIGIGFFGLIMYSLGRRLTGT